MGDEGEGFDAEDFGLYSGRAEEVAEVKKAKKGRKQKSVRMLHPPLPEESTDGKRLINYEMEKNRGLTPRRNKDLKNPRKKHRIKYQKAVVRRKGQVQDQRERREGYGGELTGI